MSNVKPFFIAFGQFILGFLGWLIISLVMIITIIKIFDLLWDVLPVVSFVVQLIGLSLAFLAFRRNLRWLGIGIVCALLLYPIGLFFQGGCGLPGLPFPLSIGMC